MSALRTEAVELEDGRVIALVPIEGELPHVELLVPTSTMRLTVDELFNLSVAAAGLAQELERRAEFKALAPGGYVPQPALLADAGLSAGISIRR